MSFNVNLAQRNSVPLSRMRERDGERETGMSRIIRGGNIAMPVRRNNKAKPLFGWAARFSGNAAYSNCAHDR